MNFPLPPKKEEVVQKLHPMGQPTEGMTVAAVRPLWLGSRIPMMRLDSGNYTGMADRRMLVFSEVAAHPGDSFAADNVIGIDYVVNVGSRGDVPADTNYRMR
jgi:hypothetical protein